jgi:hypothetical protein
VDAEGKTTQNPCLIRIRGLPCLSKHAADRGCKAAAPPDGSRRDVRARVPSDVSPPFDSSVSRVIPPPSRECHTPAPLAAARVQRTRMIGARGDGHGAGHARNPHGKKASARGPIAKLSPSVRAPAVRGAVGFRRARVDSACVEIYGSRDAGYRHGHAAARSAALTELTLGG